MSRTGPPFTGKAAAEAQAAHLGAPSSVQEESNGDVPLANICNSNKHGDRRQSPRCIFFANVCRSTSSSTHWLKPCGVRTPQILSLFGGPKGSLGLLTPFLCWLFPNVFVALVFGVTLIGCLICNATIVSDLCFLLLLIASWVFLAIVASKRGLLVLRGNPRGAPGGPPKTSPVYDALKEACGAEESSAAGQGPLQLLSKNDVGGPPCVSFGDERSFRTGWGPSKGALLLRSSSSMASYKTSATRSDLRDDTCGNMGGPEEGPPEHSYEALAEDGAPMQFVDMKMQQLQQASYSPKAAAEEAAAAAVETKEEVAQAAAGDLFPFFVGEESVHTPEKTEQTLTRTEETEATELSNAEWKERARLTCDCFSPLFTPATSSSSSKLSGWLGPTGEVSLSSPLSDLSFCRSQTLAAASLASEEQQGLSPEIEGPPLPSFPLPSLDDETDTKEASSSQPSDLRQTGPFGAAGGPLQHHGAPQGLPAEAPFALCLRKGKLQRSPGGLREGTAVGTMLEHMQQQQQKQQQQQQQQKQQQQKQQQQKQQMQQQMQQLNGSFVSSTPRAASPAAPQRRGGGLRRLGGASAGAKSQKKESRAALQYYMGLVRDCCKRRDGAGALRVLEEVQREGRVAPDVQLLNYVLFACVASQDAFLTKRLFEFIENAGVADIVTYNTMLKSFSLSGELEEAEKILRRMRARNVPPDEVSFNLLVNAAVSCGRIDRAWHYVDEIKTAHMVPDKFTISSLVKSLQPGQNPKLIRRTLRLMDGIDVCEDLILLSTCIDATMRLGDTERLRRLLHSFEASSLSPNAHAYGTLIKAYGRLGNISKVWELWRDLQSKKNMEPTNYTYGCMLDILLSYNLLADATQLFCQMVQQGVVHAVHFSILVKGLSKYNERGVRLALEAYAVLQSSAAIRQGGGGPGVETAGKNSRDRGKRERSQAQVALNTISFNALLHLCVVNGRMADALDLFHDMECQDTIAPDLISYSTVIKGLCCCPGDAPLERALSLLDQMQKRYGIQPDAIVFNTLIQGAATRKNPALVEHLLNLMQQANVPPSSYTLCQCVKLYGKCNNLQRALELANELPSRFGFSVDGYVYSALIAACVSNGAVVLAGRLALQANSSGIGIPPAVLYRLWNTLHFTKVTMQQENAENSEQLNAVHEAIWKLVGPANSKDATTICPEGIGMRRLRRRGGKQVNNNSTRQKQQQSGNSNSFIVSGASSSLSESQQTQLIPQGAINSFISAVQTDWDEFREPAMMGGGARDKQLELAGAAAFRGDANAPSNSLW